MVGPPPFLDSRYWDGPHLRRESLLAAWQSFWKVVRRPPRRP
jgi:hypothetical protein